MKKHSPLQGWLNRTDPLISFIDLENRSPNFEFGGFLTLDIVLPIHESVNLPAESLYNSWQATNSYIRKSLEIIDAEEPLWLDHDEVSMIREQLGDPPNLCYPLYMFTVGDGENERVAYIGKTSSSKGRFYSGHSASTKLHAPKYNGLNKRIYLGGIVLLSKDNEYQPLEWVHPLEMAMKILNSIEAQLIYDFQSELNNHHRKRNNAKFPVSLHVQNFSNITGFLHDHFCYA